MAAPDPCPFCGGRPVRKRPALDGARIGVRVAGTGASLRAKGSGETYLRCNGCGTEYVPAERDIGNILSGLEVEPWVPPLIQLTHICIAPAQGGAAIAPGRLATAAPAGPEAPRRGRAIAPRRGRAIARGAPA